MPSIADELQERVDRFSVRLTRYLRTLPRQPAVDTIVRQCSRSGPGIAANYRASRRARSRAEFISRLAVVVEEADETVHWLVHLRDTGIGSGPDLAWLVDESGQLRAIYSRSLSTARYNYQSTGKSTSKSAKSQITKSTKSKSSNSQILK